MYMAHFEIYIIIIIIIIIIIVIITVFYPRAGLSLQTQEPRLQFYWVLMCAVACRCFPHPTRSLASEQTLKDLKSYQGTSVEVRRVDLANLTLRNLRKFTTGVNYN